MGVFKKHIVLDLTLTQEVLRTNLPIMQGVLDV